MRRAGLCGRTRPLEWMGVRDCSPPPRTFFLAAPDRWMDALWIGYRRLIHPVSPHAGIGGLSDRFSLLNVCGQLRSLCLLSFPLAAVYPVSDCSVSLRGHLVHPWVSMHCRIGSHDTPLERAPHTPQLEYGRRTGIRRGRSFSSHGEHFISVSSITERSRSSGVGWWRRKRQRGRHNCGPCVTSCTPTSCLTP
jgi:hypothetical protein